jgi:tetratricopeptide (TPR) repeat protein
VSQNNSPPAVALTALPFEASRVWRWALLLVVITILAYAPAWNAGFIWDDDDHLTQNRCIVGPLGLKQIWTSGQAVYYPLVLTSFWVLHKFVGLNPLPYHLLNIFVHAGAAVLLWGVLKQLHVRGAWLGAALWALHPVMVQSVAWITELKNTQSCFFYLLSVLLFLKADRVESQPEQNRRFDLSLVFFAMAIASKPSTVMLPVVLALCLWWLRVQFRQRLVVLAPFFLLSAAASAWTIWQQKFLSGALGAEWPQTWPQRLAISGMDVWFYLGKLLWPTPLIFIYPRWKIDTGQLSTFLPLLLTALGGLLYLWWKRNGPLRPVFFGAAYFVVSLFPILGFFNVYFFRYSFVSDHFQYLASMGPLALAASGITIGLGFLGQAKSWLKPALSGALLLTLGILTWRQAETYRDVETLWRTTLSRNPDCWMAHNNLSGALLDEGRIGEAIAHSKKALSLRPDDAESNANLAKGLCQKGEIDEGIAYYQKALKIAPKKPATHNNLGNAFRKKGQFNDAILEYQKTIKLDPGWAAPYNNLAVILATCSDRSLRNGKQAVELAQRADQLSGGQNPIVLHTLAAAYSECGQLSKAIETAQEGMRLARAKGDVGLAELLRKEILVYEDHLRVED